MKPFLFSSLIILLGISNNTKTTTLLPPRLVVLAATNRPNALDPALRRPGR
jgi:SpoVK/Ycf46/Vps4 family AAA+-type ATPase